MTADIRWMPRWLLPLVAAGVALPVVLAAVWQHDADWHPVFDLAMTELRVRDVGGPDSPLIGLQGRIGEDGSHPGPLSFYLLAPVYRLLGSSAFALQVSTVAFHAAAVVVALWVVARRRSAWALVGVAVVVQLLVLGYGLGPLTEPWNPHLPLLWFVAFLVSAWAVLDGDEPMVVTLVVSGSVCAQTHVPYLAVTTGIGLGVVVLALVGRRWWGRGLGLRWLLVAGGVGLLLWVPPLVDQLRNDPGNLAKIVDNLGTPEEEPIGFAAARPLVQERADVWLLAAVEPRHPGTFVRVLTGPGPDDTRGAVAIAAWAAAVVAAVWLRHHRLLALHAVVGGGLVVAWVAISRIHGIPWPYLMFWAFALGGLLLVAVVATAAVVARRRRPALRTARADRLGSWAGLVLVAALAGRLLLLGPDATTETPGETGQLARLVDPTAEALEAGTGPAAGPDGTYQVAWRDATHGGAVGIGLVNELIRRGFEVGVEYEERVRIGPHRVLDASDADALVVYASGGWIEEVGAMDGAVQIALDDPRTPAERTEYAEVRAAAIEALRRTGRAELVERLDRDLFDVALNEGIEPEVAVLTGRMLDIGVPAAVFVLPGGAR